jgi:hypothetical protein
LEKYISIPHFGIKLQNIFSDKKTDNTIEFVALNYPKMTISMPQSNSGTPRPIRKLILVSMPTTAINSLKSTLKFVLDRTFTPPPPPQHWKKRELK